MIALFVLLYVVGIWLIYMKLRVKPGPVNVALAAVIGIVFVGAIVILWQFSAPTSGQLVVSRYTIQIVPQVRGPITRLAAKPNQPLRKGEDVLFEIQKDPYEIAVKQSQAALSVAEKGVDQAKAEIKVAAATTAEAEASMIATKAELTAKQQTNERTPGAVSRVELEQLSERYAASQATVAKTKAGEEEAAVALEAAQENVKLAQANLEKAEFDLAQCTVYAPADGFVTNWQVREGAMAVPLPLAPMGTFIDTSESNLVAIFSQNIVTNVKPGDKAEFALKSNPGQIFTGTVEAVIPASGEGQFVTSGQLMNAANIHSNGKFAVRLQLDDQELAQTLSLGTAGMGTIYTQTGAPFHVISKVTVRIKAWMYYLIPM